MEANARCHTTNIEMRELVRYLHALQLQLYAATSGNLDEDFDSITKKLVGVLN